MENLAFEVDVCLVCREEDLLNNLINYHFDPFSKIKHLVHADCAVALKDKDKNCPLCSQPGFSIIKRSGSGTEVDKQELQTYYDNLTRILHDPENISDLFISVIERKIENGLEIKNILSGCTKELVDKIIKNFSEKIVTAASNGQLEVVKYLVEHGADIHAYNDFALGVSASEGHLEVAKYLLEHGADIHAFNGYVLGQSALT